MEICVVRRGGIKHTMDEDEVDLVVKEIEEEVDEGKKGSASQGEE